jgi:iron complex outermembrane receptor protein
LHARSQICAIPSHRHKRRLMQSAIRPKLFCGLPVLLLTLLPAPGFAQNASQGETLMEEVVVTGTRIVRRDFSSPSPISTIDEMFLDFSGQPTLEEALNHMPQVQPDFGRTANSPGDGTSRINLRGLGAERTLVMMNGRRLAPSGAGSAVDINNLPQALIKRVEIITGGASTVYGSDAIAGVVNVITQENYEGVGLDASYYSTEQGDSEVGDINLVFGHNFADSRGNITVYAGYLDRRETFAAERDIAATSFAEDREGGLVERSSSAIPEGFIFQPRLDLGSGPGLSRFDENGNIVELVRPDDLYNFAPINYLQIPLTRYTAGLFFDYTISDRVEFYTEAAFTRNAASRNLAPVPTGELTIINLDNPFLAEQTRAIAAEQFVPFGENQVGFGLRRRWEELGPRVLETQRDYARIVAGLRGSLNETWDYDVWVTYTDGDEVERLDGTASRSRIAQGLLVDPDTLQCFDASNGCVPVNVFGPGRVSSEAVDFIAINNVENVTQREQTLASAFITGAPLSSWAGPIDVALGLEWRQDSLEFRADDALFTGDAVGFLGDSSVSGEETVYEVYGEAVIPLLNDAPFARSLELELGARYSDYDNAGSVESWKLGGQWEIVDGVRLRSIFQHSVRAPNLTEAFQEQVVSDTFITGEDTSRDPCSASADPVGNGYTERCVIQGVPADQVGVYEAAPFTTGSRISGGNPDLVPEEADTFTLGVVLSLSSLPIEIAVDYFDLELTDTIGGIDSQAICFDPANTGNVFCENIVRDPVTYNISDLIEPTSNRGATETRGIDTQLSYASDLPEWMSLGNNSASLGMNLIWTHLLHWEIQENVVSTPIDCRGNFGWPCYYGASVTFPENRITANARYASGDLNVNLNWRWIQGSDNALPQGLALLGIDDAVLAIPSIGSLNYFDLGVGYDFSERMSARLNVSNLFDKQPPFIANAVNLNNVDTAMYDLFGRSYQLSLALRF